MSIIVNEKKIIMCSGCGNVYKHMSSLSRHKSKCTGELPKIGRKENKPSSSVEIRLTNIENKLDSILLLLNKSDVKIVHDILPDIQKMVPEIIKIKRAPAMKKIKKVVEVVEIVVIEQKEEVVVLPKLSIIEQKHLLMDGEVEITQEVIEKSTKQLLSIQKGNMDIEKYLDELPEYNLALIPLDDTITMILGQFENDYAYVQDENKNDNYRFYEKQNNRWVNQNRLSDLIADLQYRLTQKYMNITTALYKEISPYSSDSNEKLINENGDIQQCLLNIKDLLDNENVSRIIQNTVKTKNTRVDIAKYNDNTYAKQAHIDFLQEKEDYNIFSSIFTDYRKNKEDIITYVKSL